jgi:16S rRNA (guanine(966)-N(2))-methyltransferase RsmD
VRQTLFDILAPFVPGCRFLDACAGSGAVGLEALSRGAARVVLIETGAAAVVAIRENARLLRAAGGECEVLRQDARLAFRALADAGRRFDVIYLDPPYDSGLYEELLQAAEGARLLADDGVLVAEHFKKRSLPVTIGRLARARDVRVGDHVLGFYAWTREG